jgi:hypothetical protein
MAGKGGARKGAGRPKNATKHKATAATLTELCADYAPQAFENLKILAAGGFERVKLEYEPAGGMTVRALARDDAGEPIRGPRGGLTFVALPLYPDLDPDALVLVGRKVEYAEPDREANQYILDRFAGKPRQAIELENGESGPLKIQVVYADPHADDTEPPPGPAEDPPGDAAV